MTVADAGLAPQPSRATEAVNAAGRFVFKYRNYLAPLGLVIVVACSRPRPLFGSERLDMWWDAVGFVVALLGQTIRVTVIGLAYIKRGGVNKELAAKQLVVAGMYAHSRNPMYVGNFLLLTGLAIVYNSWLGYLVALPLYILAILAIIKSEEGFLRGKFGSEYDDYCRSVNRFLPRLRGLRATMAAMHFDWRRVVRKEYGTTFAWISTALALLAWEQVSWHGRSQARDALVSLAAVWLLVFGFYVTARWLKKTKRLQS
jgi:protein-S-isoprenylcysteine O-methyltransferase Ste14